MTLKRSAAGLLLLGALLIGGTSELYAGRVYAPPRHANRALPESSMLLLVGAVGGGIAVYRKLFKKK